MPAWMEKFITREDVFPGPWRGSGECEAVEIHCTALQAGHKPILGMQGDTAPLWVVEQQSVLGAWGSKCVFTRGASGDNGEEDQGTKFAVIDFHSVTIHPHIELDRIEYGIAKLLLRDQQFDASKYSDSTLGTLRRKETGAVSWEMPTFVPSSDGAAAAAAPELVVSTCAEAGQLDAVISIWRARLSENAIEQAHARCCWAERVHEVRNEDRPVVYGYRRGQSGVDDS